jgi:hypothetical protein
MPSSIVAARHRIKDERPIRAGRAGDGGGMSVPATGVIAFPTVELVAAPGTSRISITMERGVDGIVIENAWADVPGFSTT